MRLVTSRVAAALLLAATLTACRSSNALLDQLDADLERLPTVEVCGTVTEVEIADARTDPDSVGVRPPPLVYLPGDVRYAQPRITPEWEAEMERAVRKRFRGGGVSHTVMVRVVEGEQVFAGGWTSARQAVRWVLDVEAAAPDYVASARGNRETFRTSATSSRDFLAKATETTLRLTLETTLNEALGQVEGCVD